MLLASITLNYYVSGIYGVTIQICTDKIYQSDFRLLLRGLQDAVGSYYGLALAFPPKVLTANSVDISKMADVRLARRCMYHSIAKLTVDAYENLIVKQ